MRLTRCISNNTASQLSDTVWFDKALRPFSWALAWQDPLWRSKPKACTRAVWFSAVMSLRHWTAPGLCYSFGARRCRIDDPCHSKFGAPVAFGNLEWMPQSPHGLMPLHFHRFHRWIFVWRFSWCSTTRLSYEDNSAHFGQQHGTAPCGPSHLSTVWWMNFHTKDCCAEGQFCCESNLVCLSVGLISEPSWNPPDLGYQFRRQIAPPQLETGWRLVQ